MNNLHNTLSTIPRSPRLNTSRMILPASLATETLADKIPKTRGLFVSVVILLDNMKGSKTATGK